MSNEPLISLERITLRLGDRWILPRTSWQIYKGQQWAIIGPNGAGKSTLAGVFVGEVPYVQGRIVRHQPNLDPQSIGYASFEVHRRIIDQEEARDEARYFSGQLDDVQTPKEILSGAIPVEKRPGHILDRVADQLNIRHLMNRSLRKLSTGEIRRVLIARALVASGPMLILDEPYAGLDQGSRKELEAILDHLMSQGVTLILVTNRLEELPKGITHILCVVHGSIYCQGSRQTVLASQRFKNLYSQGTRGELPGWKLSPMAASTETLVEIRNATVKYGPVTVFKGLNWTLSKGEHWAISGPNGSGKSTLIQLITGDNLQAYANHVSIFGRTRGQGETLWEIKAKIGLVSSELQIHYRKTISALDVVASGFFDSIGLYRRCTPEQLFTARSWVGWFGLQHLLGQRFDKLSYGEQRMVLLARAVVKSPLLLILDEPCQGLDPTNRQSLLRMVDRVGTATATQILFATHYPDEIPTCITHHLRLPQSPLKEGSPSGLSWNRSP